MKELAVSAIGATGNVNMLSFFVPTTVHLLIVVTQICCA